MGTYSKKKLLAAHSSQINSIAEAIQNDFVCDGFEVNVDILMSGGKDIGIIKFNLFKALLGMRSALKETLMPQTDGVQFVANVGIYGQQTIPTVILAMSIQVPTKLALWSHKLMLITLRHFAASPIFL